MTAGVAELAAAAAAAVCTAAAAAGRLVTSDAFWKSPAGGIVIAVFLFLVKDVYDRHRARRRLLIALNVEAHTAYLAIDHLFDNFTELAADADAVVEGVRAKTLTFDVLDHLFSGWLLYVPTFPVSDAITKLHSREAAAAIRYFEKWALVVEYEKRWSAAYAKLVDLMPELIGKAADQISTGRHMQCLEVAIQLRGAMRQLFDSAQQLEECLRNLQVVTCEGLSYQPAAVWRRRGADDVKQCPPSKVRQLAWPAEPGHPK